MTLSQSLGADQGYGSSDYSKSDITKVVMLGTGTPNPDPERSGPCVGIIVNKAPYIVDFGEGLIRRAAKISPRYGGRPRLWKSVNSTELF